MDSLEEKRILVSTFAADSPLSGTVFAQEFKEFTVFTGEPLPDYPAQLS